MERPASTFRLVASSTKRVGSERVQFEFGGSSGIRLPALFPNSTMFRQGPAGQSGFSPRLPALAVTGLVSSPSSNFHRRSAHISSNSVSCPLAQVETAPATPVLQVSAVRLEVIRSRFENQGLSSEVIGLLMASNRSSTSATYQSVWTSWLDWCDKRDSDPFSPSLNFILQYFSHLFNKGFATSTINVHRSTLSMTFEPIDGKKVGTYAKTL
jgi:hypothetical protein